MLGSVRTCGIINQSLPWRESDRPLSLLVSPGYKFREGWRDRVSAALT